MRRATFSQAVLLVLVGFAIGQSSQAQTYSVLHSFSGAPDGAHPEAGLIFDSAGNLYGTTVQGGTSNAGAIFKLDPSSHETVLYSFTGGIDGGSPSANLTQDSAGNLYGTTQAGGALQQGTAFKFVTAGTAASIHAFGARKDGGTPCAGLLQDSAGNFYGTTLVGGSANRGIVFRLDATGNEKVLHSFRGGADGANPHSGVIRDSAGNLYGTTYGSQTTWGTVFTMTSTGIQTVLHDFTGKDDGGSPYAGLIMDSAGNLYGTTVYGGTFRAGVVFKIDHATQQESVLYNFTNGADGGDPYGTLIMDAAGNLYGTTYYGGTFSYGTIFKLDPAGNETVLYSFKGGSDGLGPMAGLVRDSAGNLYGTTLYGGANGFGVVFKLTP